MIIENKNPDYTRANLIAELTSYAPDDAVQRGFIPRFINLLASDRCFYRDHFNPGHITGSAILLNLAGDQILMNHHKGLNKWLCFGGHADGDEDILNVAIRETMEESGLTAFRPLSSDFFDIDIHTIPANDKRQEPEHDHFDIRFVMQMTQDQPPIISDESTQLQWMHFDQALAAIDKNDGLQRAIKRLLDILISK